MNRLVPFVLACTLTLAACTSDPLSEAPDVNPALRAPGSAIPLASTSSSASGELVAYVPGQVIVRYRPGAARNEIAQANGARHKKDLRLERTVLLEVPAGQEVEAAARLARHPNVEFAEADYLTVIDPCETGDCTRPTDPFFGYKWDLHNDGSINNSAGTQLAVTGAFDADTDWLEAHEHLGPNFAGAAVIAILDTGIRATHQDLAGKVIAAQNFATGYPATLIEDRVGHGTHVAGIAAGRGNNGVGVAGVAYGTNIKLINAKVCDLYRFPGNVIRAGCAESSVVEAIVWAVDQGADVLNLSLGGAPDEVSGSAAQRAALQYARANNALPFCSTGNDDYPGIAFPARFPECVAVGATDWNDTRASYSNYGAELDLSAPGGDGESLPNGYSLILSANYGADNSYSWNAGTSMAAPQAAGLAALLFATGITDADDVLARMKATADDRGPAGFDPEFGHGRINVYRALTGMAPAIEVAVASRSTVNLNAKGKLKVTMLAREGVTFDLSTLQLGTVVLGRTGVAARNDGTLMFTWTDVDGDGRLDLEMHFDVAALRTNGDLAPTTTELTLRGTLGDGRTIRGVVPITVLGTGRPVV